MKKLFVLVLACMMALLISVAAHADEVPADEATAEDETAAAEALEEQGEEDIDEDELVEIDDDWGYISPEVIEQHTPEMTQEFIHADDPDWQPEEKEEPEAPASEPEPEPVQEPVEEPSESSVPVTEETAADVTEESETKPADVTGEQFEEQAEEQVKEQAEEQILAETGAVEEEAEPAEEEKAEEASKVTVKVRTSMRSDNLMHLKAEIDDPEGNEYDYQWQVSVDGGKNYEDCEDQTEDFMDVELDEENLNNLWRVKIHTN